MHVIPITFFIVKVHSRCNLNCDYCYEYNLGNSGWKTKPKTMSIATFRRLCERIAEHCISDETFISFHGGEPLMRSSQFFDEAMTIARSLIPNVKFGMQSNGTLLKKDYIDVFLKHGLRVGISLDGNELINDRHRFDHEDNGSFQRVMKGLEYLRCNSGRKAWGGILAVLDVNSNPKEQIDFFAEFDAPGIDILESDGNWEKLPPGKNSPESTEVGSWFIEAFDYWFKYQSDLPIRRFDEIIEHILGGSGSTEYFGVEPVNLITIATDGAYEAVDQIKGAFDGAEVLNLNLYENPLAEVVLHPSVQERLVGLNALSDECLACRHRLTCGGGYYPHRYSNENGFKNPSIYCADYLILFDHISACLKDELAS